ncbi:hypothetical protein [Pseudomonas capeferrum]|uniref:hypothetical protein n=1 Tax=Pseudomonas capeferrum TaxID=1495066 RepID=UPI0015E2BC04|nr:hypothetical protein [Pseudomonas capeferrum]
MTDLEHFRSTCIQLLAVLDAETTRLMQLVCARTTSGYIWDEAVRRQRDAYSAWLDYLNEPVPGACVYPASPTAAPTESGHGERHLYLAWHNPSR